MGQDKSSNQGALEQEILPKMPAVLASPKETIKQMAEAKKPMPRKNAATVSASATASVPTSDTASASAISSANVRASATASVSATAQESESSGPNQGIDSANQDKDGPNRGQDDANPGQDSAHHGQNEAMVVKLDSTPEQATIYVAPSCLGKMRCSFLLGVLGIAAGIYTFSLVGNTLLDFFGFYWNTTSSLPKGLYKAHYRTDIDKGFFSIKIPKHDALAEYRMIAPDVSEALAQDTQAGWAPAVPPGLAQVASAAPAASAGLASAAPAGLAKASLESAVQASLAPDIQASPVPDIQASLAPAALARDVNLEDTPTQVIAWGMTWQVGDIVLSCLPENLATLAHHRKYVGAGKCPDGIAPVGKYIAALGGDAVLWTAQGIWVNGKLLEKSVPLPQDAMGNNMNLLEQMAPMLQRVNSKTVLKDYVQAPANRAYAAENPLVMSVSWDKSNGLDAYYHVLAPHEVLLLNPRSDSFDGRYYGPIKLNQVIANLQQVWIFPDSPEN